MDARSIKILGAEVKGYALDPEDLPNLYSLLNGDKLCNSVIADIRHKDKLNKEIQEFQPDFVFHLAAQSLVRVSYDKPVETFEINVLGTTYLLEAVRKLERQCNVVVVTTDKVYENKETWDAYEEEDPLGGFDPYSSSKAAAEIVTASYRKSFFLPEKFSQHGKAIASARAGNVIGGGDWAKDRIIPDLVRAFSTDQILTVRNPIRAPLAACIGTSLRIPFSRSEVAGQPQKFATAFNFGADGSR